MATQNDAPPRDPQINVPTLVPTATNWRGDSLRRHVLNRTMQEKSGRLYCSDDWDIEIPSLEIYAAR